MRSRRALALVVAVAALALAWRSSAQQDGELASRTPPEHRRPADQTFLTYPEWFLVYSPREYAAHVRDDAPSEFPFLGHVAQLWEGYAAVTDAIPEGTPFNSDYHSMIVVIATSTTIEYAIRALYEGVVGRLSEATAFGRRSAEEELGAHVAREYDTFLRQRPWYEFDYVDALRRLWTEVPLLGPTPLRSLERRYALTTEYLAKAAYAWVIAQATAASYEAASPRTAIVVEGLADDFDGGAIDLEIVERFDDGLVLATVPRYEAFAHAAVALARRGVMFHEIAGNRERILVSAVVPRGFTPEGYPVLRQPILTDARRERVLVAIAIPALSDALRGMAEQDVVPEHVYDF